MERTDGHTGELKIGQGDRYSYIFPKDKFEQLAKLSLKALINTERK
jgi:hypothetical protein